ncbi:hypothetical protein [Siphonobacter sp. SORGH_AS_0500]|uniref:hypothetical protein n=1 Tax=Siphonobacter sp. SORGH_AS_0500 TaxID=1864824 RepID=UPI002863873A|nr:hypothetical protein [Siphonobacter sp. SORGH_AS_0500]MDR6195903.1 hypothetical protein [Siphonobacter sp. SORGH_AS_0500]
MDSIQTASPLARIIARYECESHLAFKPKPSFYDSIGINRIRFWKLVKGEKEPVTSEVRSLAKFLKISEQELI